MRLFKRKIRADCGHKTFKKDKVSAFGETAEIKIPVIKKRTPYCHKCLEKMTIKCAWCEKPIFIGEPITLFVSIDSKIPKHATIYQQEPLLLVGCTKCATLGRGDTAGFWYPPGTVQRVLSPSELVIQTNKAIIASIW